MPDPRPQTTARDERAREIEANAERLLHSVRAELGDRLRTRVDSADIAQEALADALADLDRFEQRAPEGLFAWLRTIARNRIRDVARRSFGTAKRRGEVRLADLDASEDVAALLEASASRTNPSGAARRGEALQRLASGMRKLPPAQREAIRLRYFEQLDVAATAARMGRTDRAIRQLCVRALVTLRQLIGDVA